MAKRTAADRFISGIRDVHTPTWYFLAQVIAGVLFAVVLAWQLLADEEPAGVSAVGDPTAAPSSATSPSVAATPLATTGTPNPSTTSAPSTEPTSDSNGGVVAVPGLSGTKSYDLPSGAVALAQLAGKANVDPVAAQTLEERLGDGVSFDPRFPGENPGYEYLSTKVDDSAGTPRGGELTFIVTVDADGAGTAPSYAVRVRVALNSSQQWEVTSF